MYQHKTDFSTGGVVWDAEEKKVLLIRVEGLSGPVWTFPKGHPEAGESDEQAAVREVREETGWVCEVVKQLTDVSYKYSHEKILYHKTVRWFLMSPRENLGKFDVEEVVEIKWVNAEEAAALVSYGSDKELLKQTALHQ